MKIYAITANDKLSTLAFKDLDSAILWVESRADKPMSHGLGLIYSSATCKYRIHKLDVND